MLNREDDFKEHSYYCGNLNVTDINDKILQIMLVTNNNNTLVISEYIPSNMNYIDKNSVKVTLL